MMTSSKWKTNVIFLIENFLSYNISKFGRKLITGKRDNLNWTKEIMTSSMKITFFEFRCKYDDFISLCGMGSGWYGIVSPTHALSNHDLKIGSRGPFWRAILISKIACFWSNLLNFDVFRAQCVRTTRARTRTHGKFWNAQNDLKRALHCSESDFEHFKIWRACTCASRRRGLSVCWPMAWSLCVPNLGNLGDMVLDIWMITWNHKMAPSWRHGLVIRLNRLADLFLIMAKILWKFEHDC